MKNMKHICKLNLAFIFKHILIIYYKEIALCHAYKLYKLYNFVFIQNTDIGSL